LLHNARTPYLFSKRRALSVIWPTDLGSFLFPSLDYAYVRNSATFGVEFRMVLKIGQRSEIPGKFWNVVLEEDGEDQLDRSCGTWRNVTKSQGGDEYPTNN